MAFLVFGWFECLALLLLGITLLGLDWNGPRLIIAATILAVGIVIIRNLGISMGVNAIGTMIIMALCLALVFGVKLGSSLVVSSISIAFLIILEIVFLMLFSTCIDMADNEYLWWVTGTCHVLAVYLTAIILHRVGYSPPFQL